MQSIHTFVRKVRASGRVTIPDEIRIAEDIQKEDIMYFAVSDRPFKAEPLTIK